MQGACTDTQFPLPNTYMVSPEEMPLRCLIVSLRHSDSSWYLSEPFRQLQGMMFVGHTAAFFNWDSNTFATAGLLALTFYHHFCQPAAAPYTCV